MRPERIIQTVAMAIVIAGAVTSLAGQVLREQFHVEPAAIVERLAERVEIRVRVEEGSVNLSIGER
jgi:hypothetical protein